jgi:hypothetical protein
MMLPRILILACSPEQVLDQFRVHRLHPIELAASRRSAVAVFLLRKRGERHYAATLEIWITL